LRFGQSPRSLAHLSIEAQLLYSAEQAEAKPK